MLLALSIILIVVIVSLATSALTQPSIRADEWNALKSRALMLDLGDGGTFNQDELAVLKQVANEWAAPDQLLTLPPLEIHHVDNAQPGPVKVSNATVTVPPIPKPGQGAKI